MHTTPSLCSLVVLLSVRLQERSGRGQSTPPTTGPILARSPAAPSGFMTGSSNVCSSRNGALRRPAPFCEPYSRHAFAQGTMYTANRWAVVVSGPLPNTRHFSAR